MASFLEMSLEDIIRRNKKDNTRSKPKGAAQKTTNIMKKNIPTSKAPVFDARNKIISKKRTQISDAREKLAELAKHKDARLKLEQLRKKRHAITIRAYQERNIYQNYAKLMRPVIKNDRVFVDSSRQVVSQPFTHRNNHTRQQMNTRQQLNTKRFLENRAVEVKSMEKMQKLKPIFRTVANDLDLIDDPMGEEYVAPKPASVNLKPNLKLRIIAHNNDVREKDRVSRNFSNNHRLSTPEREKSPPRPPSILKKRPMAALRTEKKIEKQDKPNMEFRIIVSNLGSTVTGGDIEELFGDVGGMVESRLVRPGTAEVIYNSLENAQNAVDLYHNRQLDGQPMNCLLVAPRSTTASSRLSANKPALISTSSTVEPDISTFHKVLFSNL